MNKHRKSYDNYFCYLLLTLWGRVTHICVSKLTIIGSDNGLSPDRRQAIIWTNAGILFIGPLGTSFSEISIEILTFSFKKMRLNVSSEKRRAFCLGLDVLKEGCPCLVRFAKYQSSVTCKKRFSFPTGQQCFIKRTFLSDMPLSFSQNNFFSEMSKIVAIGAVLRQTCFVKTYDCIYIYIYIYISASILHQCFVSTEVHNCLIFKKCQHRKLTRQLVLVLEYFTGT